MSLSETTKQWIDEQSYENLLCRWRFASVGDPLFQGETGSYYSAVMMVKKRQVGDAEAVAASKRIGWKKDEEENQNG